MGQGFWNASTRSCWVEVPALGGGWYAGRMAQFRIDQATPGAGTPGVSRHDLIAGEVITLTATSPVGAGVTYAWEILDKAGSNAILSGATGISVVIGDSSLITQPCSFRVRLAATLNGVTTYTTRLMSVVTASLGLRIPLFGETAPFPNTLAVHDTDLSEDNAVYADRAGLGVMEQNWRGWGEWLYQLTLAVDAGGGGGGGGPPSGAAGGDLSGTYPNPTVARVNGRAFASTLPTNGQVPVWSTSNSRYEPATLSTAPSGSAGGDLGGTYPNPSVVALRSRAITASAPANGAFMFWNNGATEFQFAVPTATGSAGGDLSGTYPDPVVARINGQPVNNTAPVTGDALRWTGTAWATGPDPVTNGFFIFQPGGTVAPGVYITWATLEAAVNGQSGPRIVYIDDTFGPAEIDTATFAIDGWEIRGYQGGTASLSVLDNCTMTINNASSFAEFHNIALTMGGAGASHAFVMSGSFASFTLKFYNSTLDGIDGTKELIYVNLGAGNGNLYLELHGSSVAGSYSVLGNGTFAQVSVTLYGRAAVYSPTCVNDGVSPCALAVEVYSEEARFQVQAFTGATSYAGTGRTDALAVSDTQLGTTEKLVGSFYLKANTVLFADTRALIGGATIADSARLNIKLGPTLIAYFEAATTTLTDAVMLRPSDDANVDILVDTAGWYDVYVVAVNAPETAVVRGLNLHMLSLS